MFAVIKTGGKQYRVAEDDVIVVEKLAGEPGATVELNDVLMIGDAGQAPTVGSGANEKAAVFAEVVDQSRSDKVIVFKKKRRHNYRRKAGHRQDQTVLRITAISPTGTKPAAKKAAAPKAKAEAKPAAAETPAPAEAEAAPKAESKAKAESKPKAAAKPKAEAKAETKAKTESKPKAAAKKSEEKASKPAAESEE